MCHISDPLEISISDSGYDSTTDQNFIEISATGSFGDYESIMLGFTNPLVSNPLNGTGMSSILSSAWITNEQRTEKFYFNKHIDDIDVKSAFYFKDGNSTSLDTNEINELINFENLSFNQHYHVNMSLALETLFHCSHLKQFLTQPVHYLYYCLFELPFSYMQALFQDPQLKNYHH